MPHHIDAYVANPVTISQGAFSSNDLPFDKISVAPIPPPISGGMIFVINSPVKSMEELYSLAAWVGVRRCFLSVLAFGLSVFSVIRSIIEG
jgi:hypothetical protein